MPVPLPTGDNCPCENPLERSVAEHWPPARWLETTVLVAVSGGADSTALLRALVNIAQSLQSGPPKQLVVAHYNHQLRGEESDLDEQFVRELAERLQLPITVGRPPTGTAPATDQAPQNSSEESWRAQRYRFFRDVAHQLGARYVALAHSADDQVETVLHRIARGTGISGLAGIPRYRTLSTATTIVRPLLHVTRPQVLDYLSILGQDHREDLSNQSLRFARNRIRQRLIPWLTRSLNSQLSAAILRLGAHAAESRAIVDYHSDQELDRLLQQPSYPTAVTLRGDSLLAAPEAVLRALLVRLWQRQSWPLQAMSDQQWRRLTQFLRNPELLASAELALPSGIRVRRLSPTAATLMK
ncbi:MAG: tRNA lysidine(34) synthetase TilS [Planctomycetota bacterium]